MLVYKNEIKVYTKRVVAGTSLTWCEPDRDEKCFSTLSLRCNCVLATVNMSYVQNSELPLPLFSPSGAAGSV